MKIKTNPLPTKPLPKAPPLRKMIGPSFILLGLGLGSGEVIMWPYLAANYGMGIIWGAVVGLTLQFFMNMEIERYTLARGESVFMGFGRLFRWAPTWFALSTFIPWMWPGIATASATLIDSLTGSGNVPVISMGLLISMGLILSLGPVLYKTVENLQKILIIIGVPSIFVISFLLAKPADWSAVANGLIGHGDGFWLLPAGISITAFLGALAYAGAGGNLNLAQSFYVKEKGLGMGKYAGRITSLLTGKAERITLSGAQFTVTPTSAKEFATWWRRINIEHFLVFWLTGSITIVLLSLLAYTTVFHSSSPDATIGFVIKEAAAISQQLIPVAGTFFLLVAAATLFGTQLTVFDATSRIISENIVIGFPRVLRAHHIRKIYYAVLWLQIIAGIAILSFGFQQPLQLLMLAATLNSFAMFIHSGMTLYLNKKTLHRSIAPNRLRSSAMVFACMFYGSFSIYVIATELQKMLRW